MKAIHKLLLAGILFTTFVSCTSNSNSTQQELEKDVMPPRQVFVQKFQSILDSIDVKGSILLYDPQKDQYYSNNFEQSNKGHLPASTFKITNSIIALETAVVTDENTLFKWNGEKRRFKSWEQDLTLKQAFHFSCVPCYQDIARNIGSEKMNHYLDKLKYGSMTVDTNNIDMFWLEGESRISQFEQIDFLNRFYRSELPISGRTEQIMKSLMIIDENTNYTLTGKTGLSITNDIYNAWFVGYVEFDDQVCFFATNIEPNEHFSFESLISARKIVTNKALSLMGYID